jgi:hypothetical protein
VTRALALAALLLAPLAAAAQPVCTSPGSGQMPCQSQAVNPQPTDIVLGTQATGPQRANQTVFLTLSQIGTALGGPFLPLTGGTLSGALTGTAATFSGLTTSTFFRTPSNSTVLSGSTNPTRQLAIAQFYSGASTIAGNTSIAMAAVTASSDNAGIPNGARDELLINGNYGGNAFTGFRNGLFVQMNLNAASTLSGPGDGLAGYASLVTTTQNQGGVSTGFGTTSFGLGSLFGSNPWARAQSGGTFLSQVVGTEVDASINTGASANRFVIQQIALTSDHKVHGTNIDAGQMLVAQVGTGVGVRWGYTVGDYTSQWPIDPNGLLFMAQSSENGVAQTAAGGIDLLQATFSGTAPEGGNFALRTAGSGTLGATAIDGAGGLKIGSGYISANAAGLVLDAPLWVLSGTPTIGAGGANYTTGDIVGDSLGNLFTVTASGGVVSAVAVTARGEGNGSNQSATVATAARTRTGASYGTGLTLVEAWSQSTKSVQMAASGGRVGFYGTTPIVKATPTGACAGSTGCQAIRDALGNLGLISTGSITN